jgi:two-component system, OmpR family, alkaline phosphatase synthesis response regulator PhoP
MSNQTIVVAEDQQHVRKLIMYKLENSGYQVVTAEDGVDALAKIREIKPTLVLLDVMMPLMTGFEVLAALKQEEGTKNIPVILVTAQSREDEILRGLEFGAEDYITKPFSPNELAARVKKALLRIKQN